MEPLARGATARVGRLRAIGAALAIAFTGCDVLFSARIKVLTTDGHPVPDVLISRAGAGDHDLATFTDREGCAHVTGIVGPGRALTFHAEKDGFVPRTFDLPIGEKSCFTLHLARPGSDERGAVDTVSLDDCSCPGDTGYRPTLAVRFKVSGTGGAPIARVGVRRSDRPSDRWSQVTDAAGCL